jgi:hypothetical protein
MSKSKIFARGALGALLLFAILSPALAADACPDLSGTFECPASGKQPAMTLTVTNKRTVDGGMLYKFTYRFMGRDISSEGDALPKEVKKADPGNLCAGGVYFHRAAGEPGEGTRNSLTADGNYERASGGKVEMTCVRKKQ